MLLNSRYNSTIIFHQVNKIPFIIPVTEAKGPEYLRKNHISQISFKILKISQIKHFQKTKTIYIILIKLILPIISAYMWYKNGFVCTR